MGELFKKYVYYAKEGVALTIILPFILLALPFAVFGYVFTFESYEENLEKSGEQE